MKKALKFQLVVLGILLCLADICLAGPAERINSIRTQKSQQKVDFSINIVKADSGKVIYSHNPHKALVPASNMKLIITAAAIKYLGYDYEYKTRVGLCGDSLVIIGGGDPLLGDGRTDARYGRDRNWVFKTILSALKENKITSIRDILIDSSIFDDRRIHPSWPKVELNRDYACEVSGLNFNRNCIEITAKRYGGKVKIFTEPKTKYVEIINKVKAIDKGKSAIGAYRTDRPNKLLIRGRCRNQQGPVSVAIERPAMFFGFVLAENLSAAGITMQGHLIEGAVGDDCDFRELVTFTSPITDCLARCNKDSFGLVAEALVKTIAAHHKYGRLSGSWSDGVELISSYLVELGINPNEFYIDDGSGLSKGNRLSANSITTVLLNIYNKDYWGEYKDSLAVGGIDGTISKYFREDKYKGKILGKTGYITGVKSFSGVCETDKGDFFFAVIANNANGKTRKAINGIVKEIFNIN